MRSRKRPKVKPRELRKASRLREPAPDSLVAVPGKRERTQTGYRIDGTRCKDYETFFEHIANGQATDTLMHTLKTRTVRVLSGRGFAVLSKGDQKRSMVLTPGIELTIEPGIKYALATTSDSFLDVFVSQSGGYKTGLQVIEKSSTEANLSDEELQGVSNNQAVRDHLKATLPKPRVRRKSKAAAQQTKMRQKRGQVAPAPTPAVAAGDRMFKTNLRPSYGADLRGEPG